MKKRETFRIHFKGAELGSMKPSIKRQQVVYGDSFEDAVLNLKEKYLVVEVYE